MVLWEIETHIEEQKEEFLSEGMNMQEAEEAAVREMGDPVAVGIELNKIHRPQIAWSFSYLLIPIYAGIVWHYRQQGYEGLVKSTVILAMMGVFSICILVSISTMCLMVFIGVVMLQMAICQGGFGKSKRKNSVILWSVLFALPVVMGIGWMAVNGCLMGDYQWNRLSDFLRPEQNTIYQRIASGIKAMTENADVLGSIPYDSPDMSMIKGEYLWNYLYQAWGSGDGIALTLAEAVLVICLLLLVLRQKNQLGKMLGISCVLFFALQIIRYVGMNFGYAAPASVNMPFLSYGNINLMISYLYVGLGLSVHYNSNLINN